MRLNFVDANPAPTITASDPLPGRVNDLRGDDSQHRHTDIPTYAGIVYQDLYAGIDLRYDGDAGRLKSTYTVAPGVDPQQIRWRYGGVEHIAVERTTGALQVTVAADQILTEAAPVAWQEIAGQRVPVPARYHVAADSMIGFALGAYNPAYPLVIGPILEYSTYLGGEGNEVALGVAMDAAGNMYLAGFTYSPDFPTKHAFDAQYGGGDDAFVTKIGADGCTLVYSIYLGGTRGDSAWGIAVDRGGNAYVSGLTSSGDFLTTPGAWDRTLAIDLSENAGIDAFVTKLNAAGSALVYSTFLGGTNSEFAGNIAVDAAGSAYVLGHTFSTDFPTKHALQPTCMRCDSGEPPGGYDAYVTKLNPEGTALVYSTYLGGTDGDDALG